MPDASIPVPGWRSIEEVIAYLEEDGTKLPRATKIILEGQREINGLLYKALEKILDSFPKQGAPQTIVEARALVEQVPGKEPPGCPGPLENPRQGGSGGR